MENKKHLGYKENTLGLKVLTLNGYEIFDGINKISVDKHIVIKFKGYPLLRCSLHHPFIDKNDRLIKAKDITAKHRIKSIDGLTKLEYKFIKKEYIELYDIVNSGSDHIFFSNSILSHNCSFQGSAGTLIKGRKLEQLASMRPIRESKEIKVYEEPIEGHKYVAIVDTAEGVGQDYSVVNIIDVSQVPYKQVFVYRDNNTVPKLFAPIAAKCAKKYNTALLIVESNNASGGIVTHDLWYDIEYENMLMSKIEDAENVAGGAKSVPGIRTTKRTKSTGCSFLKDLVESDQITINDKETISELSTFIRRNGTYMAERNKHDDIAMTLVIFAWFTQEPYFEEETGIIANSELQDALLNSNAMDEVFGFISNGVDDEDDEENDMFKNSSFYK